MLRKMMILTIAVLGLMEKGFGEDMIVTIDSHLQDVLRQQTQDIQESELPLAQEIARQLYLALEPHFPAAGLAAPQIGISRSVFIFSYDRNPEHLEAVVNPSFTPIGDQEVIGWEGCLSVILSTEKLQLAKLPRYQTIQVSYLDLDGNKIDRVLDGFAAKVFQHEYDHLQGIVNIERADAIIQAFTNKEEMEQFIQQVKKEDAAHYKQPASN